MNKIYKVLIILLFLFLFCALPFIVEALLEEKPSRERTEEEIENIVDDPSWNIPSRYRD